LNNQRSVEELLKGGLRELGYVPEEGCIRAFLSYLTEIKEWNKAYNLTALKKDGDIIIKHFLDSLLYMRALPEGEIRVADVGSGAGFPGIPIKIMRPEIEMYLLEPSRKKSAFLRNVIRQLGLKKIEVIEKRIEEVKVGRELPHAVDVALTRALFTIKEFLKKALPIVTEKGILILSKGPKVSEEITKLKNSTYELFTFNLPFTDIKRHIVVVTLKTLVR